MADLANIDPAVKDAKAHTERPAPAVVLAQPLLTTTVDEETKQYTTPVNTDQQIVVKCSDNNRVIVPKTIATELPFAKAASGETDFPFPVYTLQALAQWVQKYGAKGTAASHLPQGPNTFIDFTVIATEEWDKQFYLKYLKKEDDGERFIHLINAAEKYGLEGLLNFAIVAFGVELRGESDATALKMFHQTGKPTAEETAAAAKAYPWFEALTRPTA